MLGKIQQVTEHEILETVNDLKYFTYPHGKSKYYLHFFCYMFDNENELVDKYEEINDIIAFNFQSHLKEKIEKWNIYLLFFLKGTISKPKKVIVEQNKYATRKMIFDCFTEDLTIENQIATIKQRVLLLGLETEREKVILTINEPHIDEDIKIVLEALREKNNKEKKEIINKYVKGVENEH